MRMLASEGLFMESRPTPAGPGRRRTFTAEFKAEAVRLCEFGDRSIAMVAEDLGISESSLRRWFNRVCIDAGRGPPDVLTTDERLEGAELRRQSRLLLMERDFL